MPDPIDPVVQKVMEHDFVKTSKRLDHQSSRLQDASDFVALQSQLGYLTEQRVVGVREAKASSILQPVQGQPYPRKDS